MRATILPWAIILTKAHRAAVSMIAKGCILVQVLPLRCFLFLLPNYMHVYAMIMQHFSHFDKREVLQQEYSQPPILPSPHFRWVVNTLSRVHSLHLKETTIQEYLVKYGPLSVSVDATTWNNYMGGIIQYHCGEVGNNHAVVIVGYDKTGR